MRIDVKEKLEKLEISEYICTYIYLEMTSNLVKNIKKWLGCNLKGWNFQKMFTFKFVEKPNCRSMEGHVKNTGFFDNMDAPLLPSICTDHTVDSLVVYTCTKKGLFFVASGKKSNNSFWDNRTTAMEPYLKPLYTTKDKFQGLESSQNFGHKGTNYS